MNKTGNKVGFFKDTKNIYSLKFWLLENNPRSRLIGMFSSEINLMRFQNTG